MVYPHLDCRVGFRRIASSPSGSSIRPGLKQLSKAARRSRTNIEERIQVPAAIYQWKATEAGRERALAVQLENRSKFQQAFSQGLAVLRLSPGCGRKWSLRTGYPYPGRS